jgi:hypothetical protein
MKMSTSTFRAIYGLTFQLFFILTIFLTPLNGVRAQVNSCVPETAPTQVQDFSTFTGAAPTCWSAAEGALTSSVTLSGTSSGWTYNSNFANANSNVGAYINLWSNSDNWLISNEIDLGNTVGLYQLKYKYAVTEYGSTSSVNTLSLHKVDVVVSTDGGATWSNTNIIKSYAGSGTYSNTGAFETVLLSQYSGVVKIAFVATCIDSGDLDFFIDDFQIELAPACSLPTALSSSNISYQTATIGWTAPSAGTTPSNYDYEVRTTGAAGSGATGLITSGTVSTTSANITGLTGATYSYYVRSSCGNGDFSSWSDAGTFETLKIEPTNQITELTAGTVTVSDIPLSWTAAAIGSQAPDGYLVKASSIDLNSVTDPVDGTDPSDVTAFTSYSANKKQTSGTATSTTSFTGMDAGAMYHYKVYSYTISGGVIDFKTDAPATLSHATRPNQISSTLSNPSITANTIGFTFSSTNYLSGSNEYIIFAKAGSAITTGTPALNLSNYTANATFGSGTAYEADASAFCVHKGDGTTINLTGLNQNITYHFLIYAVVEAPNSNGSYSYSTGTTVNITTVIPPASFPYSDDFSTNNFTFIGTQTNKWAYGSAVGNPGSSIYVSNDNGTSNAYTNYAASVSHAYRDIEIPSGTTIVKLSFDWLGKAEANWDYTRVWLVPTSFIPIAGSQIGGGPGMIQVGANFDSQTTWQTYINNSVDVTSFANTTMRLVFSWRNDGGGGIDPPGAIDNVSLTLPPPLPYLDDFSTNNFTFIGNQTNKWAYGSAEGNPGSSIYVSNDNGTSNAYTNNSSSVAHAYCDIPIPSGTSIVQFSFDWLGNAEPGYDYTKVWLVPTSFIPSAGSQIDGSEQPGMIPVGGNFAGQTTWQTYINNSVDVSSFANTAMRLVFEWRNDGGGGANPTAIDNVSLMIPPPSSLPYSDDFSTNNFTFAGGNQTNRWRYGSAVGNTGSSIYVSNNGGGANAYTHNNAASVSHAYCDIPIPYGTSIVQFSFDWLGNGESGADYTRVWLVPTSFTPIAGTQITSSSERIPVGGDFAGQTTWQTYNNNSLDVSSFANTTMRLVFSWRNDGSAGANPPGAIDNIALMIPPHTWTGGTSTDWNITTNWDLQTVPTSTHNVIIPSTGITNFPEVATLTNDENTTITIQSGAKLDVTGTLTNNGTLTLESGATLVQGASSTLAGSGTYNVQQAITGANNGTGRFWYLGSPVSLASSSVYFGNAANVVKKRDEESNAWTVLSSGSPESLVVGRGYFTQAMGNATINFTGGLLNNGAITIGNLTRTAGQFYEGFNLVSNPYPSYLDWDAVTKTDVGNTMWYRTASGSTPGSMVFDTYVAGTNGIGTNLNGAGVSNLVPPMQSFWVRVNSGSTTGSLGLSNSMRAHFTSINGSTAGLKSTSNERDLFLRMNLFQANKKDQIIVYVNDNATNGFDVLDGEKMMQAGMPQFYTSAAGKKITINGLNSAKKQQALPITMELPTTGVHSFVIEDLEIDNGLVWLEDKQEEIMQALEPGTVYEFYANSGINAARFVLHFQLIDNTTPINVYNEVNSSANFNGKGASVHAETAGVVVIKLPATTEGVTDIQIRDAAGRLVYTGATNALETIVQLEQSNGIYYVTLNGTSGVEVRKVFIQQ